MGAEVRSARDESRGRDPQVAYRRAAPDSQRAGGPHELRGSASGAAAVRGRAVAKDSLLRAATLREAGDHRLGAALLSVRIFGAGRAREAPVRLVLHQK